MAGGRSQNVGLSLLLVMGVLLPSYAQDVFQQCVVDGVKVTFGIGNVVVDSGPDGRWGAGSHPGRLPASECGRCARPLVSEQGQVGWLACWLLPWGTPLVPRPFLKALSTKLVLATSRPVRPAGTFKASSDNTFVVSCPGGFGG